MDSDLSKMKIVLRILIGYTVQNNNKKRKNGVYMRFIHIIKNRNYTIYLLSRIVSIFSDGLFRISAIWTLVDTTGSANSLAILLLLSYLPQLLVGLVGGYLVDYVDRKKILVASDMISALSLLALTLWYNSVGFQIGVFFVVRFVLSLMDVFYSPAAVSFIPKLVSKDDLQTANSIERALKEVCVILSYALAGIIISKINLSGVLWLNTISYFVAALMVACINVPGKVERTIDQQGKFSFKELTAGIPYIRKHPFVLEFIILIFLLNIAHDIFYNLPSLYSLDVLNGGVGGYSALQIALSIGMLVGAAVIGTINFKKAGRLFCWSILANGIILILLGLNHGIGGAFSLYFLFAFTDALSIPAFTYLQLYVEDDKKGRVFALFDTIVLFSAPVASLLLGLLVSRLGILRSYVFAGIGIVFIGILAWRMKNIKSADLSTLTNK